MRWLCFAGHSPASTLQWAIFVCYWAQHQQGNLLSHKSTKPSSLAQSLTRLVYWETQTPCWHHITCEREDSANNKRKLSSLHQIFVITNASTSLLLTTVTISPCSRYVSRWTQHKEQIMNLSFWDMKKDQSMCCRWSKGQVLILAIF